MKFDIQNRSIEELLAIYSALIKPRWIEERMLILLRQGKISKWFSGIGQEAISVGAALVLDESEYILPMHRNLGVFTTRGIPLDRLFSQFQGKYNGFTKGRDRSFHFGTQDYKIVGMISHLGAQLGVADGIAYASLLTGDQKATMVFTGDGGASEGDFHEALNVASVWSLPVIFIIENNGYGLSTPSSEQFNFDSFVCKGPAYGIEAISIDGNNILEVVNSLDKAIKSIRENPRPMIVEAMTFRMRGHEEASGTKYVPKGLMEKWVKKDPIDNYEAFLLENYHVEAELDEIKIRTKEEIDVAVKSAFQEDPISNVEEEEHDVYYPYIPETIEAKGHSSNKRFVDAIKDGLKQSLEAHPDLVIMGQDIAEYGGVFKITEGLLDEFGHQRIKNTPICESAIIGASLGLSIQGIKSVVEMQFADFVSCGFNQIINNLAKTHYRWGQPVDVTVRMPTGAGVGAGPFHSQSDEAWFFHTPGLKVIYPSNPYDAKGLLCAAIDDPNPCLFFEHKYLYRSLEDSIPDDRFTIPIGKAKIINEGTDLSIITYGWAVHWTKELQSIYPGQIEVIDLRSLLPWDKEAVAESVKKTGKVLILHEDTLTGGIGGEISAWISENCFEYLDAPIVRVASLDTPVPFASTLENNFLPKQRLMEKVQMLIQY